MDAFSYVDIARSGVMNMAIDEALLNFVDQQQTIVLRLYQWSEPTLSLGYFQRLEDRSLHPHSRNLPVVRRATGGGAIVHHHDLTYSLCIPQLQSSVGAAPAVYHAVHGAVVSWLRARDVPADQWSDSPSSDSKLVNALRRSALSADESTAVGPARSSGEFLCFRRRSAGDVVANEHKVLGSAQRRAKGALLQHGSLLLATSDYAPSLTGLSQMSPRSNFRVADLRQYARELKQQISAAIATVTKVNCSEEFTRVLELEQRAMENVAKFSEDAWLSRV